MPALELPQAARERIAEMATATHSTSRPSHAASARISTLVVTFLAFCYGDFIRWAYLGLHTAPVRNESLPLNGNLALGALLGTAGRLEPVSRVWAPRAVLPAAVALLVLWIWRRYGVQPGRFTAARVIHLSLIFVLGTVLVSMAVSAAASIAQLPRAPTSHEWLKNGPAFLGRGIAVTALLLNANGTALLTGFGVILAGAFIRRRELSPHELAAPTRERIAVRVLACLSGLLLLVLVVAPAVVFLLFVLRASLAADRHLFAATPMVRVPDRAERIKVSRIAYQDLSVARGGTATRTVGSSLNDDCTTRRVMGARISRQPKHGTAQLRSVTAVREDRCRGVEFLLTLITYKAVPHHPGQDMMTIEVMEDGGATRIELEINVVDLLSKGSSAGEWRTP